MTRRARASDVRHLRATYKAIAECKYEDEANADLVTRERCHWTFVPRAWHKDADTRREAKAHVLANPGHDVVVLVRDVTRYYLDADLVASLTTATPPADVDDQPDPPTEPQED